MPHTHTHTAHPSRNKVRGGARKSPHSSGHSSPCTSQGGKFLLVCPKQQPVTSAPVRSTASVDPSLHVAAAAAGGGGEVAT